MAKKVYDVVATIGKYNDRQTGDEKKRYLTVGAVFQSDNGTFSMKLDAVPTTPEWTGWLSFYEPKQYGQQSQQQPQPQTPMPAFEQPGQVADNSEKTEQIPF